MSRCCRLRSSWFDIYQARFPDPRIQKPFSVFCFPFYILHFSISTFHFSLSRNRATRKHATVEYKFPPMLCNFSSSSKASYQQFPTARISFPPRTIFHTLPYIIFIFLSFDLLHRTCHMTYRRSDASARFGREAECGHKRLLLDAIRRKECRTRFVPSSLSSISCLLLDVHDTSAGTFPA